MCVGSHTRKVKPLGRENMCADTAALSARLCEGRSHMLRCSYAMRCSLWQSTEHNITVAMLILGKDTSTCCRSFFQFHSEDMEKAAFTCNLSNSNGKNLRFLHVI